MINITQEEIMNNWSDTEIPLVSVICCTYNQEQFIAEALEGFLIQKTNFPFEVLVNDDASTDGTEKIINEYEEKYPKIIKPFYHDVNEYSQGIDIFGNLVNLAKGKYIANCEGDDYWIDENKLQMQVDFLEKNNDYGFIYGNVKVYLQEQNEFGALVGRKFTSIKQLIKEGNQIPTCSVLLRKDLLKKYISDVDPVAKRWLMGDYPLNLWMSYNTKIKYLPKVIGVYRVLRTSASHSDDMNFLLNFAKSTNDILSFFKEKYNLKIRLPDHVMLKKFNYYLEKNDRQGIIENSDFSKITKQPFIVKVKVFIYKNDFLYSLYRYFKNR